MATSAGGFLKVRRAELSLIEFMHPLSARFLAAYAGADPPQKTPLLFGPEMLMMIRRSPSLSKALGRVNYLARVGLPAKP
jgi:hypothetical protein